MRKNFNLVRLSFTGIFFLFSFLVHAQAQVNHLTYTEGNLAEWSFYEINSPVSAPASRFSIHLVSSNLLTRGTGAPPSPGNNSFLTTGFKNDGISTSNSDYFQFTLATDPLDTLSIAAVTFSFLRGDSEFFMLDGVYSQFAYSLDGVNFILIDTAVHSNLSSSRIEVNTRNIIALQDIPDGTTVIFRYYVTGNNTTGACGFVPVDYFPGLSVRGIVKKHFVIMADSMPIGADYVLTGCDSSVSGSIGFTSYGNFPPGNVYTAKLNNSQWAGDTVAIILGTLNSSANSGTIDLTIPGNVKPYALHRIWIESSSIPRAFSAPTAQFKISRNYYCQSLNDRFRSKQSGNWNDINTWELCPPYPYEENWTPSPFVPDQSAGHVYIRPSDSIAITTPVKLRNITIDGKLTVLNGRTNAGSITYFSNAIMSSAPDLLPTVKLYGILQIVSDSTSYNEVVKINSNYVSSVSPRLIDIHGKIIIGDGSSLNGPGFCKFATAATPYKKYFWSGVSGVPAEFEWNTTSINSLIPGVSYFDRDIGRPILRIRKIGPAGFGAPGTITTIYGRMEVNTPVEFLGSILIISGYGPYP
ncbi:MAG TPA: hypothetical protein VI461_07835 [Chitinophagaceae bacterium]|nr:hypothetical protein [Chitinophagaceae bacterium]